MAHASNRYRNALAVNMARVMVALQGRRYMPLHRELAAELGMNLRTLRRYLDALEQAGWPMPQRGWHKTEAA